MDRAPDAVDPGWPLMDAARLMRSKGLTDEEVEDAIRSAIERSLGWDSEALVIEVDQGRVTLAGTVEWTSDAIRLIRMVRDLDGVVELVSKISSEHSDVVLVSAA